MTLSEAVGREDVDDDVLVDDVVLVLESKMPVGEGGSDDSTLEEGYVVGTESVAVVGISTDSGREVLSSSRRDSDDALVSIVGGK